MFRRRTTSVLLSSCYWSIRFLNFPRHHCLSLQPSSITQRSGSSSSIMSRTELLYQPYRKHSILFEGMFLESWLHSNMIKLVQQFELLQKDTNSATTKNDDDNDDEQNKEQLQDNMTFPTEDWIQQQIDPILLRIETKNVYSFDCFNETFINLLNEEIQNFYVASEKYNIPIKRPNSMNNYGVVINEIGLRPLITSFQQYYLWPIARILFPLEATHFDYHHSFIVRYQSQEDLGLDMHIDDSDVTFNVCLGQPGFKGATLQFCGMFGSSKHRKAMHKYHHEVGRAILHLGNQRHGADNILEGKRMNLIVWNHNYQYRHSPQYRMSPDYKRKYYQSEEGPPDEVCLSYTHDKDYLRYKQFPESVKDKIFHPWCPPLGKEYPGYFDNDDKTKSPKKSIRSQDEL